MPVRAITRFMQSEYASCLLLILATVVAMFLANSQWAETYQHILHAKIGYQTPELNLKLSISHWINDGLMVLFFLVVGLEIKREFLRGELSSIKRAALPIICAIGGVVFPALIFAMVNRQTEMNLQGWAIPTATDIAFALGLLALGGKSVPLALKVFLMALAIIDDLVAILIIAIFYGQPLQLDPFLAAVGIFFVLIALNMMRVHRLWPYLILGVCLWYAVMQSGLHPTIAGVLLALTIPVTNHRQSSPLHRLEEGLHSSTAFIVMPVFALANAGLSFSGIKIEDLMAPLPLGVALGLFLGKQIGILLSARMAVYLKWAEMPTGVTPLQFYAAACFAGIGFTMSLFIGSLAFEGTDMDNQVRLGVIVGSVASAVLGLVLLRIKSKPTQS